MSESINLDFLRDVKEKEEGPTKKPEIISSEDVDENIYSGSGLQPDILTEENEFKIEEAGLIDTIMDPVLKIHNKMSQRGKDIDQQSIEIRKPTEQVTEELEGAVSTKLVEIDEIKKLNEGMAILDLPKTNIESLDDIKSLFDRVGVNADGTFNDESLDQIIQEQFSGQLSQAKGKTTNLRMIAYASNLGLDEVVSKIRNLKEGQLLDAENFLGAMLKADVLQTRLVQLIDANNMDKLLDPNDIVEIQKIFITLGELSVGSQKSLSGYGRGLLSKQLADSASKNGVVDAKALKDIMEDNAFNKNIDPKDFQKIRFQMSTLTDQPHKVQKVAEELRKTGMAGNWLRFWSQIYVNGLLSNPAVPALNVISGLGFNSIRNLEYYMAAGVNKVLYADNVHGASLRQALEQTRGHYSFLDGLSMSYNSLFKTPDATKIDYYGGMTGLGGKNNYANVSDLLPQRYANIVDPYLAPLDYALSVVNVPTKLLVVGDQLIKGVARKGKLNALGFRERELAISQGHTLDEAIEIQQDFMRNPPKETVKALEEEMVLSTFQQKIDNSAFQIIRKYSNTPLGKIVQPFTVAMANIYKQGVIERGPIGMLDVGVKKLTGKSYIGTQLAEDLSSDDLLTRQLAQARMGTGVLFLTGIAALSFGPVAIPGMGETSLANNVTSDVIITGSYPVDRDTRNRWMARNVQPESFGFKQPDGTYKFISYRGLGEPINQLLVIGADSAYAMSRPGYDDPVTYQKIITSYAAYMVQFTKKASFMDNLTAVGHIMNSNPTEGENVLMSILGERAAGIGSGAVNFALGPASFPSGFNSWLNKRNDPTYMNNLMTDQQVEFQKNLEYYISQKGGDITDFVNETFNTDHDAFFDLDSSDVDPLVRDIYRNVNSVLINAGYSHLADVNGVKRRLNMWAEPMVGPEAGIMPWSKVTTSQNLNEFRTVDKWMEKHGLSISMPNDTYKSLVKYTADQYDMLIRHMNRDTNDSGYSDLLEEIDNLFKLDPVFQNSDVGTQRNQIDRIMRRKRAEAVLYLEGQYPELKAYDDAAQLSLKLQGRK